MVYQNVSPENDAGSHAHSASAHDASELQSSILPKPIEAGKSSPVDANIQDLTSFDPIDHNAETPLFAITPPPPYNLVIENLTIGVPLSAPVPLPNVLKRRINKQAAVTEPKAIVHNVSATCANGEMLVIIGASGSGKTTVLNAIVGRLANLPINQGTVSYWPSDTIPSTDHTSLSARMMKQRIGFVKQQDTLLEHLTVRETLRFSAALRLPKSVSKETRDLIVNHTIEELGLREAADTIIGGALRKGISGGERRRLSIGCALVSLPSVLVADEPTTGLDAFTAYSILLTLSRLAHWRFGSLTVICTLHQPRSATFTLFDRILLLSRGRVVYSGAQTACLPWFQNVDDAFAPGRGTNPMDWLIDISTVDHRPEKEDESRRRVTRLIEAWGDDGGQFVVEHSKPREDTPRRAFRSLARGAQGEKSGPREESRARSEVAQILDGTSLSDGRIGLLRQTLILLGRASINMRRNYGMMLAFFTQSIFLGVIFGLVFYRLPETPSGIQSLKTMSLQHLPYYTYLILVYSVYKFCTADLIVFDREQEDNLYSAFPWVLSEILVTIPVFSLSATLFAIIIYFMCGMRSDHYLGWALGLFITECIIQVQTTVSMSLLASSIFRIYALASTLVNALQIFIIMSAGLLLIHPPVYINWIRWLSQYFYGFRVVVISQFRDRTFACDGITGTATNQCDGNQVLQGLYIDPHDNVGYYIAGLIGLTVMNYAVATLLLACYHPGGLKHASRLISSADGNGSINTDDIHIVRQRVDVQVQNLSLTWTRRTKNKRILHGIRASFPSGEVTAVLGPSGAGKSSLLQLIAGRYMHAGQLAHFDVAGQVLFNGSVVSSKQARGFVSFVEQDDAHHLPALSVRETVRYAAILRLPKTMSKKSKIARAEEVIQTLGLSECADNFVGGELLKGISGGEKRRLSLAVEMISDPAILVVDEPTSGLDALTANNVMLALKAIAASGRTVIVSIHQPRSDIWHAGIDNVLLLAKGGQTAFSGPKSDINAWCDTLGFPLPNMTNPADWILDLISFSNTGGQEEHSRVRVGKILNSWVARQIETGEEKPQRSEIRPPINVALDSDKQAPMHVALPVVLERMAKNLWRQKPVFFIRVYQVPLMACIFLLIYQRLRFGPTGGQDRLGFVNELVSPLAFVGLLNNVAIFPADRDIFWYEVRSSAAYSSATFLFAFTLIEIPLEIVASLLGAIVSNFGNGMQTSPRIFFELVFVEWSLLFAGESIGIIFGVFTQSMGFNVSLVSTFITIMTQASGVLSVTIPGWVNDLAWGTTSKLAARVVMINECRGLQLYCTQDEISTGQCLVQTGEELLALVGWNDMRTGRYCAILLSVTLAYRLLAWLCIWTKVATF
ncbi:hypothetical protein FRB93_011322 [Tulasnella sp. JGI-2019a]|nr:hypothetical protein FRB93_011322 [Tulasnella sp. JGI-2019a]